ncbi:unnamed protein product [Musa acuminata subsp. malaccensis]|uniref:(wild Malaysian banana) hypothetical protein n=1 Tax=Musa acuminata subsp. malaccensis TaxID=214687 RepID=A0A804KNM1_MUSAM|nr:unnamed protein product [Musa acuminata subsp. malaccensis]
MSAELSVSTMILFTCALAILAATTSVSSCSGGSALSAGNVTSGAGPCPGSSGVGAQAFGIIALEIACGRRPVEPAEQPNKVRLVEWVWDLFGRRAILEAAYEKLHGNFDEEPWVAHGCRAVVCSSGLESAAIDEASNLETPLSQLPPKMPVPMYCMPSADEIQSLDTSLEVK